MTSDAQSILNLLFNSEENICVSNSKFAFHSIKLEDVLSNKIHLLSSNPEIPESPCDSKDLILCAINPINGFRLDKNVAKFRSFLWECDTGSISEQLGYFKHLKVPLSAQIFSGNKSIHAVTTLKEDNLDEKTYRYLYTWALKILSMCDQACRNPSRSVRIPGPYRENGKKQELLYLEDRIPLKDFMSWLMSYPHLRPIAKTIKPASPDQKDFSRLSAWCRYMLKNGIDFKRGRNQTWYALAYDFALAGFSLDTTIEMLHTRFSEEHDFKEKEFLTTINSAFKSVEEKR